MRKAIQDNVARVRALEPQGDSISAPVWGWDALNPLANMKPDHAIVLDNWFPQPSWCEIRKGEVEHSDTGTGEPVETIMAYHGDGGSSFFAASGGDLWDLSANPAVSSATGFNLDRWQHVNFAGTGGSFLYAVNGTDVAQYFDGVNWADSVTTGVTSDAFIQVNVHKNRIWAVLKDSTAAAYLPLDSIAGAAETFEVGGYLSKGGFLMAIGTWTVDAGSGPDDYLVFVSSEGQAVVFSGLADPSDAADFQLVGVFDIGPPIGRRCMSKVGGDLAVISIDGVIPLSRALITDRAASGKIAITNRIQSAMNRAAQSHKGNFGWQLIGYPKGTRAILNVPEAEGVRQVQFVMNTLTGAWCRFLGMNANCWEVYEDDVYFGGNDGIVYKADTGGQAANGEPLVADCQTAFNYLGQRGRKKQAKLCRPVITTDGSVNPSLALNFDFKDDAVPEAASSIGRALSLWGVALWGVDVWPQTIQTTAEWQAVSGSGHCVSIRMTVTVEEAPEPITLNINSFDLLYEVGGAV